MKQLLTLALITGALVGCVVPMPFNTATHPIYPVGITPPISPSSLATHPVLATTKTLPSPPAQPIPIAYNTPNSQPARPVSSAKAIPVVQANNTPQVPVVSPIHQHNQQANNLTPVHPVTTNTSGGQVQDLRWLADRIAKNQTDGNLERLVKWNHRENFAVLGIGQFIWYPAGKGGRYNETFPAYLNYVKANSVPLPAWLAQRPARGGPWINAAAFRNAQNDIQMKELRNFMQKTLNLQANFMVLRLNHTIPKLINQLPSRDRQRVMTNYQTVLKSPGGLYPLLDYIQFQGDGSNPAERYNGTGWGLLQVLQNMENVQPGTAALAEFMRSADDILVTRIANAPTNLREARQLDSWLQRVNTYRPTQR